MMERNRKDVRGATSNMGVWFMTWSYRGSPESTNAVSSLFQKINGSRVMDDVMLTRSPLLPFGASLSIGNRMTAGMTPRNLKNETVARFVHLYRTHVLRYRPDEQWFFAMAFHCHTNLMVEDSSQNHYEDTVILWKNALHD